MRGLRKVSKPKVGGRRFPKTADPKALESVRKEPCLLRGRRCTLMRWIGVHPNKVEVPTEYIHQCEGVVEAHHIVSKARGGHDGQATSLCSAAHKSLHDMGRASWEKLWGVDLQVEGAKKWAEYQRKKASGE